MHYRLAGVWFPEFCGFHREREGWRKRERERERGGREREREKIKMDRGHKCCAGFQYDRVAHLGGQGLFSIKKREGTIAHLPFYTISTGIVSALIHMYCGTV